MAIVKRIGSLHDSGPFFVFSLAALLASTLLLILSRSAGFASVAAVAGCVLAAIGYAMFLMLWFELYACVTTARMVFAYACSNILSAAVWQLLSSMGSVSAFILLFALPVLSAVALVIAFNKPEAKREALLTQSKGEIIPKPGALIRVSVWIACFSLATGFFLFYNTTMQVSLAYVATGAIIVIGYVFVNNRFDFSILYRISLLFVVLGFVLAPFVGANSNLASFLVSIGKEAALAVALAIACNIAYRKNVSGAYTCGFVYFANIAAMLLGKLLQTNMERFIEGTGLSQPIVLVVICVLCIVAATLVFNEKHFTPRWQDTGLMKSEDGETQAKRVHEAAVANKLGAREEEILSLLVAEKSYAEIGEELFISPATVRVHVNHIVSKMQVDGREALINTVRGL